MIWLEGVSYRRDGMLVLDAVTLGVASIELVVVFGAPASGKSSLLELAAVAHAPDAGTVWFAGRNIATLQRASLPFVRRNIGYVSAAPILLAQDTALENVLLALAVRGESYRTAVDLARAALALVKASDLEARRVASLSSGQKRLVALARALAGPPPLIVVDEPAAGVGGESKSVVVQALVRSCERGAAVLCATSDATLADDLVRAGGRKIHLDQGSIAGAPAMGLVPSSSPTPATQRRAERVEVDSNVDEPGEVHSIPHAKEPA